jgi:hypothetical protein
MPRRNLKYSTDWHLLTRQNSYNASKQKRHNANDTNQFILYYINCLLGGDFIGLMAKRAFRFLVNVFGFILDNLDPFNLFPLKEPIESNPTRKYDLFYKCVCSFRAS